MASRVRNIYRNLHLWSSAALTTMNNNNPSPLARYSTLLSQRTNPTAPHNSFLHPPSTPSSFRNSTDSYQPNSDLNDVKDFDDESTTDEGCRVLYINVGEESIQLSVSDEEGNNMVSGNHTIPRKESMDFIADKIQEVESQHSTEGIVFERSVYVKKFLDELALIWKQREGHKYGSGEEL